MTIEVFPALERLGDWAASPFHEVIIECQPNGYLNGLPEWNGRAHRKTVNGVGIEVIVEAGPCPNPETVCQMLIERLRMAWEMVP